MAVYKSRTLGPGSKVNPKTESMLQPVRGDRVHRPMSLESGKGVKVSRTAGEMAASRVCFEGANDSNTVALNSTTKRSEVTTITDSSNFGMSTFDIVPYPHSYELPDKLPEELPEDIPGEPPIVWIEVTIKCVTDHEEGVCSLMIIQDDVSERENAQIKLSNLTEAQLTIMAETYPRHIIDFFSVSNTNEAPKHVGELASSHQDVTIMFKDIVGFTAMCKERPLPVATFGVQAADVLTFLNQLFTPFDLMCDMHDVQKVETAGDCYIIAAGIIEKELETGFCNIMQEHDPVHSATKVLAFAKNMLSYSKTVVMPHNQQPVVIRIGMHTGPCVSGLIGTKLPKFSILGDTMNTASRLLLAGRNNDPWQSTPGVEIKGKGLMNTFTLEPKDLDFDAKTIFTRISSSPGASPLRSLVLLAKTISRPNGSGRFSRPHPLETPSESQSGRLMMSSMHFRRLTGVSSLNPNGLLPPSPPLVQLTNQGQPQVTGASEAALSSACSQARKFGTRIQAYHWSEDRHLKSRNAAVFQETTNQSLEGKSCPISPALNDTCSSMLHSRHPVVNRPSQKRMDNVARVGALIPHAHKLILDSEQPAADLSRPKETSIFPFLGRAMSDLVHCSSLGSGRSSFSDTVNLAADDQAPMLVPYQDPTQRKAPMHPPDQVPTQRQAPILAPDQAPSQAPSQAPTYAPNRAPTHAPTHAPDQVPTQAPGQAPSQAPTYAPTHAPNRAPTHAPTHAPNQAPTHAPDQVPTQAPGQAPSQAPTYAPTHAPNRAPTHTPDQAPTHAPDQAPSQAPTYAPTHAPNRAPTHAPTHSPNRAPTHAPTHAPIQAPTQPPTRLPTHPGGGWCPIHCPNTGPRRRSQLRFAPDQAPTHAPNHAPNQAPTQAPDQVPTLAPDQAPTHAPNQAPNQAPTQPPGQAPTQALDQPPTLAPDQAPTHAPNQAPNQAPTQALDQPPTLAPDQAPNQAPTQAPTYVPMHTLNQAPTQSQAPDQAPTHALMHAPDQAPTQSQAPNQAPTLAPDQAPNQAPTHAPTLAPNQAPTQRQKTVELALKYAETECAIVTVKSRLVRARSVEMADRTLWSSADGQAELARSMSVVARSSMLWTGRPSYGSGSNSLNKTVDLAGQKMVGPECNRRAPRKQNSAQSLVFLAKIIAPHNSVSILEPMAEEHTGKVEVLF
eukprot:gene26851-4454_t